MHGEYLHLKKHLEIAKSLKIEKTNLLLSGDLCQLDLVNKNHKLIEQFVIKKLPVIQNLIIEEENCQAPKLPTKKQKRHTHAVNGRRL